MSDAAAHLRPFFPAAADFAAATTRHFQFLVDDFGFEGPAVLDHGVSFDIRYDGDRTAVLLSWDVEGGFFGCHLVRRHANGRLEADPDRWLSTREVLAARGALAEAVSNFDLEQADETSFARTMERQASNLVDHCADVLRGDWSIYDAAHRWLVEHPDE